MFKLNFLKPKVFFFALIFFSCNYIIPLQTNFHFEHLAYQNNTAIVDRNYPTNSNFLVLFKSHVPDLKDYENNLIKRYKTFPAIFINFQDKSSTKTFLTSFKDEILEIELNRPKITSLADIKEINPANLAVTSPELRSYTGASYLHQIGLSGYGVRIGIIDSGVTIHPEFGSRIIERASFVSQENGYSQDISSVSDDYLTSGHGTHIAGIAAGSSTGIAPQAEIYSAKIIHDPTVLGAGGGGGEETTAGILDAIDFLVNKSVDIINLSIGQYHNLPGGVRDEVINFISEAYDILVTVSAGNSGSPYGDRGTLHNPGTALECLSVAASDITGTSIASFSSSGLKVDYSLKPDLSAPGVSIPGPDGDGSGFVTKSGTSIAAPVVAGGAALLIEYLRDQDINYTSGTLKAALLEGAQEMNAPIWKTGAGFLNLTKALIILNSSETVGNYPELIITHPKRLPIDPYEVLFTGSSIEFNLTVISSRKTEFALEIPDSLKDFVKIPSNNISINGSSLLPINFSIPNNTAPSFINDTINIGDSILRVQFEIRKPLARILFDESLNSIVQHGYGTGIYDTQGDSSNTVGMYSSFTKFLVDNNYCVTPHLSRQFSLSELVKYDVLVLANPFSLISDIYMDWVIDPGNDYFSLTETSLTSILQFFELGGGILILSSVVDYYNITELNNFLDYFGLAIDETVSYGVQQSIITNPQKFTKEITEFPFRGNFLKVLIPSNQSKIIADVESKPTLISHEGISGGRILLFGTDLIFDNIGFSSYAYGGNSELNRILAFNSVAWLVEGEFKETSTIPEYPELFFFFLFIICAFGLFLIYAQFFKKN